ncbi:MAG TPA: carbamoyltransferase C-terminal domain-containing protein [Pyrinomonadaceae bacterium]|nr:carbamoyltransferase C-terminal domain-containing protein [Pyrinomonadaceae bacterium]
MPSSPTVLGINRTQDASICFIGDETLVSIQKERLTRRKHHWGKLGDFRHCYVERLPFLREPVDLVVECFSSDAEIKHLEEYDRELQEVIRFRGEPRKISISHHFAHLYSTFYLSPFEEAAVMVIDFQGSPVRECTEEWPGRAQASPELVEVSSFYHCDGNGNRCLGKQLWDVDHSRPEGLGAFYCYLSHLLFPGEGNEGKVMGLAPYGDPQAAGLPPLVVEGEKVFIPAPWLEIFNEKVRFGFFRDGSGSFQECADLAAAGQFYFEAALLQLADWLYRRTKARALCFSGGTALNCVANGRLLRESSFEDIFVPPSPHDGGTALGCAVYGLIETLGVKRSFRWVNDFLGPDVTCDNIRRLLQQEEGMTFERPEDLAGRMAELLEGGRVVALYQGRSELGPRALGHRSILADPRRSSIRTYINQHVKGRELFRPLAPVVLEEVASYFFEIDRPVPFMQFAVNVRPEQREVIPAVTHVDGTARLQTINEREDPFLYSLLKSFQARTGIGVLLNTSFNGPGDPIVETPAEALHCFKTTAMHALAIPPFLIRKRAEPKLPRV